MAPPRIDVYSPSQNLPRHQPSATSPDASLHSAVDENPMLNPSAIAGITVGSLVALIVLFCGVGAVANCISVSRRKKRNKAIENQYRRWPKIEHGYPPVPVNTFTNHYHQPKPSHHAASHSADTERSDSSQSYQSQSSQTRLLTRKVSKNLPDIPLVLPSRPESNFTMFEDSRLSDVFYDSQARPGDLASASEGSMSRKTSVRPRKPPPARLRIPTNSSAPPPIIISPPREASPSNKSPKGAAAVTNNNTQQISSQEASYYSPSRLSPPAPSFAKANQGLDLSLLTPASISGSPGYLPSYYTNPTPAAPVTPSQIYSSSMGANSLPQTDKLFISPISASVSAPDLDPSSASSGSTDTSFESTFAEDAALEQEEERVVPVAAAASGSPLKDLRYPRVPKPTEQENPRSGIRSTVVSSGRRISSSTNGTSTPKSAPAFRGQPRGAQRQLSQNIGLRRKNGSVNAQKNQPSAPVKSTGESQQLPLRQNSEYQPPDSVVAWALGQSASNQAQRPLYTTRSGDMFIAINSP